MERKRKASTKASEGAAPKNKKQRENISAGRGTCCNCNKSLAKSHMPQHLKECLPPSTDATEKFFIVNAKSGVYWMYFKVPESARMQDIDGILRNHWMDCCGHLSRISVIDPSMPKSSFDSVTHYTSMPYDSSEKPMTVQCGKVLKEGLTMRYEYDFGTTSTAELAVIDEGMGPKSNKVELLAKNNSPKYLCKKARCEESAKVICQMCYKEFCSKHKHHGCSDDMLLPVCNSPRMGMCGYTGPPWEDNSISDDGSDEEEGEDSEE